MALRPSRTPQHPQPARKKRRREGEKEGEEGEEEEEEEEEEKEEKEEEAEGVARLLKSGNLHLAGGENELKKFCSSFKCIVLWGFGGAKN